MLQFHVFELLHLRPEKCKITHARAIILREVITGAITGPVHVAGTDK